MSNLQARLFLLILGIVYASLSASCQPTTQTKLYFRIFNKGKEIPFVCDFNKCIQTDKSGKYSIKLTDENKVCRNVEYQNEGAMGIRLGYLGASLTVEISYKKKKMTIDILNLESEGEYSINIHFQEGKYVLDLKKEYDLKEINPMNPYNFGENITPVQWEQFSIEKEIR